jgi:hypothetical protein
MSIRDLILGSLSLHRDPIMSEFDPRRDSMRKLTVAVAAALALGTVMMAAGSIAFARGGGHFSGGGGHFAGGHFAGGRFGWGFGDALAE